MFFLIGVPDFLGYIPISGILVFEVEVAMPVVYPKYTPSFFLGI